MCVCCVFVYVFTFRVETFVICRFRLFSKTQLYLTGGVVLVSLNANHFLKS